MELGWLYRTAVAVECLGQDKTDLGALRAIRGFKYSKWETGGQRCQGD